MTKIRDIIQINSGYTSYVDLYEDYYDLTKNRGRMERYKPIAAHRMAIEKIANALNPRDRRFYFLSGSYGTGKSHLLLMMANYFANPSDVSEIEAFFKNYEIAQKEVLLRPGETLKERTAASLKEARKSGRYLVALCRYSLNLDFEGALLRALEEALEKDDAKILLDSHYSEALRRIEDWEARRTETRFYADLEWVVSRSYPDWTIGDLVEGLKNFDERALKAFKHCFREVTDSDFSYKKDNLRDIISDFLKNQDFKDTYRGIVFLYDEFGAAIDNGLVNYTTLLDFAQYCASSTLEKGGSVIFIGTGHKAFRKHGQIGDLNAETLEARVSEIGLQTQGMEDIISAIVQPQKDSTEWMSTVQMESAKFTWFSGECNRLRLFNWLPAPKIKNNIIQNIYPMHPLATYALLKLAGEAGSDNRSVFKFFAPEFETGEKGWINVQPYSYPWFIESHEIKEQNKLALFTPDFLVDYFRDSLKATNTRLTDSVKAAVVNYEATVRELNAYLARKSQQQLFDEVDDWMVRILKVMLVNEIVSNQDIPVTNTAQNIEFALDAVSADEKAQVEQRLRLLAEAGVIFNNKGVYELTRSDRKDISRLVEQYKANPDNRPENLLTSFLQLSPLKSTEAFLDAKEYNDAFNEDKRLKVYFASPSMLTTKKQVSGQSLSYFAGLDQERRQLSGVIGYEGCAVYVFCENESDLDAAKKALALNNQERVLVSMPRSPISLHDAVFTLIAMNSDWFKAQAQNFSAVEKAEEKKVRDDALKALEEGKRSYFSNAKMFWFGIRGAQLTVRDDKPRDAANELMLNLYGTKRTAFAHTEFNKVHINLSGNVRAIFKEAGDILCDLSQPIRVNWTLPDNRGGTRYLRKCFADHQALRITSQEGDNRYLEAERDINKFRTLLPAYARLLEQLASLEGKGLVILQQFLKPFYEEYGQGDIAVTLMLLLARRYYGDGLRFKRDQSALTDIQFSSTDDLLDLVQGKSSSAVILFEPVSAEDQAYFAKVTQIYTNQPIQAGKVYTISDAFQAITSWWNSLPVIARSLAFYEQEDKPLGEALSQAQTQDPFYFVKNRMVQLLGQTPGESLSATKIKLMEVRMTTFKKVAEAIQSDTEEKVLTEIASLFGLSSSLDVDIQEALRNWHNSLSSIQKDALASFHNNDSKPLVKFTSYANIRELLFITLPEAYSLGRVSSWMSDFTANYIQRMRSGKTHIENNAPQISALRVDFESDVERQGNHVKYQGELILHAETEDGKGVIYYTEDGSDPTNSKQRKKLASGDALTIKGNRKVKFTVADNKGNYSAVQTFDAIDELEKFSIRRSPQQSAFDEAITFVFPKTKDAARTTVTSLFRALVDSGLYTASELKKAIQESLDSVKQ
ncbi:MAG TPA: chitobiase/beta-hexosaminidase C-terminal domain-containing protein [Anaerolineales bacterium]|nr:chitobiase/beta-hexosaminidase C-terminal domain-containing protein [Anaerolineales bacterium]